MSRGKLNMNNISFKDFIHESFMSIGLDPEQIGEPVVVPTLSVSDGLARLLADSYVLYLKTQHFHWNVTGPFFGPLHSLFNELYDDLFEAIDLIAERIRALGAFAPGSFSQFAELTCIEEERGVPSAEEMVDQLLEDNTKIINTINAVFQLTRDHADEGTATLLADRLDVHGKANWKLRSILETAI